MKRRLLALLLTAAMLLGMTPVSAVEAEGTVITGFAALEQNVMEAETSTAREDLGLPETVTATVLETVTTLTGNGEGEDPTVTTEEVETEREIPVEWSPPLFGGYDPDQAGEYTFTAGAQGYVLAEGVEWPTVTVTLTEPAPEAAPETAPEVQAVPVITGFTVDGDTSYEVAAHEEMTEDYIAAGLVEDVTVTAAVDGEDVVLPVDWSCPDFDGQTGGVYTFTAYAQGYALADGAAWPTVTVEVTGAETLVDLTATVTSEAKLRQYLADGETTSIYLGRNITVNSAITVPYGGGDMLDLQGYTLTLNAGITVDGNLVIGNGTIKRGTSNTGAMLTFNGAYVQLLSNLTINGSGSTSASAKGVVVNGTGLRLSGQITVTGSQGGNLCLASGKTVSVDGLSGSNDGIGVTQTSAAVGAAFATSASDSMDPAWFVDDTGAYVAQLSGGSMVWAEDAPAEVYVSSEGDDANNGARETPFATLSKALETVADGGTVYVMNDVTTAGVNADYTKSVTITTDPTHVDETGILKAAKVTLSSSLMTVNGGAGQTVTLKRISLMGTTGAAWTTPLVTVTSGALVMDIGAAITGHTGYYAPVYISAADGSVTLNEGAGITNNTNNVHSDTTNYPDAGKGGGVYMAAGTLTMNGGAITGNKADNGGGVAMWGGTMTMEGGEIGGNETTNTGGGVYAWDGTLTIGGGAITRNTASISAGGVCINNTATMTMTGGAISNNTASDGFGGGVLMNSTMTMSGGEISGNTVSGNATGSGGGVYVNSNAVLNLSGAAAITGNKADNKGGGVSLANSENSVLNLSGAVTVTGNTLAVGTANNVYRTYGAINVTGALTEGASVGVTDYFAAMDNTFAAADSAETASASVGAFSDDTGAYLAAASGQNLVWAARRAYYVSSTGDDANPGTQAKPFLTLKKALETVADGGTVCVMNNLSETRSGIVNAKNVTITTDPDALSGSAAVVSMTGTDSVITQQGGAILTLRDIVFNGGAAAGAAGTANPAFVLGSRGDDTANGKLVLDSGAVIRNFSTSFGAVWTTPSAENAITMKDGASITGNTSNYASASAGEDSGCGGGITLRGGVFTMEGGTITNNTAATSDTAQDLRGGGVYMGSGTTMTMTGGEISGNTANIYGGGVYANGGTLTIDGGKITGNTATADASHKAYGGGVFLNGSLTLKSGEISGNAATGAIGSGGGVYLAGGTLTMEGGEISSNRAVTSSSDQIAAGGGVYLAGGTLTMEDGKISGNTATTNGGGVYAYTDSTLTMSGGEISGNTAVNGGGVLMLGTMTMTGGTITGNKADSSGGVYMGNYTTCVLNLSGAASITGNTLTDGTTASNVYKQTGSTITVTGALTEGASVGVTDLNAVNGVTFATATDANMATESAKYFFHDGDAYQISVSGTSLQWKADTSAVYVSATGSDSGDGTRAKPYLTLKQAMTNVADGGTIYVMNDVKTAGYGSSNYAKNVTITTDPKALTKDEAGNVTDGIATATLTGALAIPYAGNTITLENITFDGTGCPTGSAIFYIGTANGRNSGNLHLKNGTTIQNFTGWWGPVFTGPNANNTVTVESGARIINNTNNGTTNIGYSDGKGGGITMNGGTLTMNGGEISGNTAPYGGGGVYLASSAKMVMNGGTISGNTAVSSNNGGGVYADGTLAMNGGEIRNNTAGNYGGGVFVNNGATMTMSGGTISGNTASTYGGGGVYLGTGTFTMNGGTITGNKANTQGGGVWLSVSASSVLNLSGEATVTGNTLTDGTTTNNVYKQPNSVINVTGNLTGTVGVTALNAANGGAFATATTEDIATASAAHFLHDGGTCKAVAENTSLKWAAREAIQLDAPTVKGLDYTSVTIEVKAGQTYILRTTATGEALQTFAAPGDGTHTFQDLTAGTAYYIYTTLPGQAVDAEPYYTDSANTVVRTRALAGTELIQDGSFEKQNADKVWLGLNVDSAVANPEIGVGKTSYGLTAADGSYVCELNGTSGTYPEAVYQKVSVYPGATINVTASVAKRASYNGTMQIGVMPATESLVWSDFTAAALTPTVTSGSAAVNDTVITPVSGWSRVQCTYTVPEGVYEVYVIFQALTPTGGAGNLIDKISVKEAAEYYVASTGSDTDGIGTRENPYQTLAKAVSTLPEEGGTIHVMDTVTQTATVSIGKNVTITGAYTDADGNVHYEGKLLRGSGSWAKDSGLLKITAGTTTLQDISLDGNNNLSYESSLIRVTEASTLILKSGAVLENNLYKTTTSGIGTVFLAASAARMEMYDGAVIRNNRAIYGAAVTIYNNNTGGFYMYGGEIYGNWTSNRSGGDAAGAVQVGNQGSTFVMSGGSIHNNGTSTTYGNAGAGVCLFDGGIVRLSGAATIQDNFAGVTASADNSYTSGTKSNLYLTGSTNSTSTGLSVTGDLTGSVGVTQKSGATMGGQFAAATNATIASNSAGAFSCDTDEYVGKASSANLVWAGAVASVTKADGTVTEYSSLQAAVNAAGEGDTVTLLADTSETVTITTSFDTLEWNGKTLTGKLTINSGAVVNTIQNTVDGAQNYTTGGISGGNSTVLQIQGTVGEIKGGYYRLNAAYEAVAVSNTGKIERISGGWFYGNKMGICWMGGGNGGTVITGGVLQGDTTAMGAYNGTLTNPIVLEGGYYSSNTFTFTSSSTLDYTGTLSAATTTLPEGYGGISTTTTYYTLAQTDFYVSSDGSDTTGDGTRENPYQTVYRAVQALDGVSGTIYIMDTVNLDSDSVKYGSVRGYFYVASGQSLTIKGDPESEAEARIQGDVSSSNHMFGIFANASLTLENVILDGMGDQGITHRGAAWLEGAGGKVTLGEGAAIINFNGASGYTMIGSANVVVSIYLTGGQITGNTTDNAISLPNTGSRIYISGDSTVTGNVNSSGAEHNIAVASTSQLVLAGDFTGAAGVYQASPSAGGQFGTMGSTAYTGAGSFTCDSNPALSSAASGSNLVWAANRDDVYVSLNGSDTSGDGTKLKPYKTLLYAYGKVNAGGTIHVMTASVPTAVASGYVNALGKYIAVNKNVTISGEGYDGASVRHNNGNAPILMASNSNYTTTFKEVGVTSAGSALLRYGNADNALIDIRNGVVTMENVTVSGHYNNGTANGRSSIDWSDGTIRVAGGTLNLTDTTVTGNTTNGAVYKIGGTVNLSGATSITNNTRQGTGGANLYLKTASQSVNVADDFAGTVGVTQVGTAQGVILAVATGETQAQAKTGMFTDDANTGFEVRTSGANLIWGKDIVTYVPDKYRIVVISDNAEETYTITKNGVTIEGTKVYDEELGQYVTTFEGLDPNTTYPVASSKGTTQNVKTLNITALEKAIRSASPFTVYEGETVSLATVLGSKVAHLSGCVSLTDMSISDESYATVSGSGRTAKITGVQVTGDQQIDLTLTASTRGCGVYGTCNTGEITIQIIVVPQVVIRTTVANRTSIVVGDCSTKLQYALYDASGNLVSDWVSPSDDGEGGLYVRFDSLTESTNYTVKARYGDGDNDYGTATKTVKTTATSALQKAIESASPFTIYEGETVTLASVLGSKVYHLSGCVSLSNMNVADTTIATVSGSGRTATITGVKLGSTDITMTASTTGCYYYGTTTANGVKITVNVIPKMEIKSVSTTTESITVSGCDPRFQYALYDADGNPVGATEWLTPNEDGTITWDGLTDKTNYTVMVRYGDGNNSYGTASKTVTTGQIYTGTVEELYSFSQGTGVTAGFKVNMAENPGTGYTLQVTDASGDPAGTATLQGSWYGGNYVVKVTNLTAGTTYTVQAVVGGNAVGEALEWTAPAATSSSHNSTGNTSGYWSSSDVSTKTDSSGATQVVSGIAYNVKSNGMSVDIQGYGKTKTTYANAGWTVKVSGGSNLWVWAEPTIVKGESGADYVVLTYHIRNNSASSLSNVWLGANADIMIGSNDRAPVYMEDYGIRTAVNEADDALSFAIITQHGGGVAEYADSVTTRWFGYYGYRNNYTFSNTNSTSLTGTDSGAAFSWKIGALAAGETQAYSVVIGVAGKEDQNQDITNPAPFTETETGPEETVTQTQLAAPTVTETTTDSVTIQVKAGQTYILRLDAEGESYMEFEATEGGTYTFEGLAPSSTYYIYTKLTEQDADANPFYTESANATAATKATAPGQPKGDFILHEPTDWNENDLTYQFGNAEATLTNVENFKNLSVMVDTGSFTLTQEALTALGSYGSVAGVSASGGYVKTVTAGSKYTYLIFSGTFTKTQAENFLRALIFNAEGYGVYQQVDVDADVIDLPSGVARLGSSYYRYVAYRGITWSNAYKAAKASSFNGLPGYLITVDSSVEHNFVYQTYGNVNGWMGGLRTTATSGFDGATYNTYNPGTSGAWKWVCGPNAGDPFWNGWNSSSSNRIPGVYANWNSGEPNNASGEWAAQYGFGSGGRWNDYKPTNSAIGGYFIEYTAYGSYSAADPMAHDDQTNVFGAPVAVIWINGVKGTKTYSTLARALEDYTDSTNQVIQMIANTEEPEVTVDQDVYLDLNGYEVKADITVSDGCTLYGLDTTTDGYQNLEKYGQITGTVTGQVGGITKTTKSHFAKAKNYLPVSNENSLEFHRFNTVVYKYTGKIDNEAGTAMLNYTLGFQGDSTVVGQLEAIGAGARISGSGSTYTYGWNYDLSAVPSPSNPYLYDTNLVNLSTTEMVNGYTTYYDLVGALKFGEVQVDSESVKRSFLQVLKLYYNKTNVQEKEEIMTFITSHNLNTEWEALG